MNSMHSERTAERTCGRREAVDEPGEQPEGRPNRPAMTTGSKRPRAQLKRQRERNGVEETGARENEKRRKQHPTRGLPLPNRNNHSHCNKCNCNNSSSGSSNAATVAAMYVVKGICTDF